MAKQTLTLGRRWYVLHTYSGYEENVKRNLEQRVESFDMRDKIFNVLVDMVVTDDSWYVVRNTPNVTGFIGSGTTPTPIDGKEMDALQKRMKVEEPTHTIDVAMDDPVRIIDGPFKNFEGKVSAVDAARGKVKVLVSMFGRETPVELDALQVKKL